MRTTTELQRAVANLRPPPTVARRVLQIVAEPAASTDDLLRVVRSEPALTASVIALSNSTVYNLPRPIVDVSQSVAYLGTGNLIRMVVAQCVAPSYRLMAEHDVDAIRTAWCHAIATGVAAQLIAQVGGAADSGASFAAGLLHDLGKLVFVRSEAALDATINDDTASGTDRALEAERRAFGSNHATAGEIIAELWELPGLFRRTIRNHHHPEFASRDPELTAVVHVADLIALQTGYGLGVEGLAYPLCEEAVRRSNLRRTELDLLRLRLLDEMHRIHDLLRLAEADGASAITRKPQPNSRQ